MVPEDCFNRDFALIKRNALAKSSLHHMLANRVKRMQTLHPVGGDMPICDYLW